MMASSTTKNALRVCSDRRGTTYRGTAEQLLEAGVVELRHLPVLGNAKKHVAAFTVDGQLIPQQGHSLKTYMQVKLLPGKKRYEVFIRDAGSIDRTDDALFSRFMERTLQPVDLNPACASADSSHSGPVFVRLSKYLLADYAARNVFPMLRRVQEWELSEQLAIELLNDAYERRREVGKTGYAFVALIKRIQRELADVGQGSRSSEAGGSPAD